jgi:hypothetical protein
VRPLSPFLPHFCTCWCLVVLSVGLALGVKDAGPVLGLEGGLGVHVDLDAEVGSLWNEERSEEVSEKKKRQRRKRVLGKGVWC